MRIWHLMAGVLAVAIISALLARSPVLGGLVVLDMVVLGCAFLAVRNDHRVLTLWSRAQRRSERIRGFRGRIVLLAGGSIVFAYEAITSLVMSAAFLLVATTGVIAVAEIIKWFSERL
jgi:hypothetical protein